MSHIQWMLIISQRLVEATNQQDRKVIRNHRFAIMSVYKASIDEIRNADMHYTTLPSEVLQTIATRYGATTLAVWTFLLNQAPGWVIRKDYVCKVLKLSERKFQEAMRNLDELSLAWLATGGRDDQGRLHGTAWHVSGLPRAVFGALEAWRKEKTDYPKNAESVAQPETPVIPGLEEERTDYAENRLSAECTDITSNQELLTNSKTTIKKAYAQSEFARFYSKYPKKRDRGRAEKIWLGITKSMKTLSEISELADACIANVEARIKTGEWRDLDFIPYAKSYLSGECWQEQIEGEGSAIRMGIARGETIDEIFNPDPDYNFDDGVIVEPNAAGDYPNLKTA